MNQSGRSRRAPRRSSLRWAAFVSGGFLLALAGIGCVVLMAFFLHLESTLPSMDSLRNYHPPLVSSVYSSDGTLVAEFNAERRYIVPIERMPGHLIKAFLAAEDVRFYEHGGVDLLGIVRAMWKNFVAGEIVQGGSTITQQVVKSILLTPEKTYVRKVKEAVLAYKIDHALTKDQILFLYLNQIYFGSGAYGVEAAAQTYFEKHVQDLSLAEASLLAGLPKAPSRFSPHQHFQAAKDRQRYVLQRMAEVNFISAEEARIASSQKIEVSKPKGWKLRDMNSFTEEVRRDVEARYGKEGLYREGLKIYTTMDRKAQEMAEKSLDIGLRELDKRHSRYRGLHLNVRQSEWASTLKVLRDQNASFSRGDVVSGLVTSFDEKTATAHLDLGNMKARIPASGWEWARISTRRAGKLLRAGDLVRVRLDNQIDAGTWSTVLEQDPSMEGSLMAMDPTTGRVLCMVGGRDFQKSQFNRATQALRQPGSAFKPVIYAAALDKGFNEISTLIDAPLVLNDHSLRGLWKPANYDHQFWGPIPLRRALIHSRNVVTVKLLSQIGVPYAIDYARRLGIHSDLTPTLALALGSSDVTLSELLTAYSPFANSGSRVEPYLIERIQDRAGNLIEERKPKSTSVIPPETAYLMTNLLQGVIEEGTGAKAKELGRPAAGKTGTTNEMKDAWFVGYTPEVLAGVWIGYDDHTVSLGKGETGGRAACPIWTSFMKDLLKDEPIQAFAVPDGVLFARINPRSGSLIRGDDPNGVYAAFAGEIPNIPRAPRHEYASSGDSVDAEADDVPGAESDSGGSAGKRSTASESFFKSDLF